MLIKEYRIPLPLTVDEYRIAQLYMIAKKSRNETDGEESGVEIIVNEPYDNGPGGSGQYTQKIYHVGSHLPGWFKSLLPKSALTVEEEAWNAYPYTRTRYTCPFVEKFSLDIETYYFNDGGHQNNVFSLSGAELASRQVDLIDVVRDQQAGAVCAEDEDPRRFVSQKTGRGPLGDDWIQQHWTKCQGKQTPLEDGTAIMCAYKLCKVEFRYWGMQSKIERFIHDVALRKTMLHAHCQAWAWQDEWHGMTMDDIRRIEDDTQRLLAARFGQQSALDQPAEDAAEADDTEPLPAPAAVAAVCGAQKSTSRHTLHSPGSASSRKGMQAQLANWRMESIRRDSGQASSEEEFYDCEEDALSPAALAKCSSLELLTQEPADENSSKTAAGELSEVDESSRDEDVGISGGRSTHTSEEPSSSPCICETLLLVLHSGSVLDAQLERATMRSDFNTFRAGFDAILSQYYPSALGRMCVRPVFCPSICSRPLELLCSLSPGCSLPGGSVRSALAAGDDLSSHTLPMGAIPLLAVSSPSHWETVQQTAELANHAYRKFLRSPEGHGFHGQVSIIADSMASLLLYDILTTDTVTEVTPRPGSVCSELSCIGAGLTVMAAVPAADPEGEDRSGQASTHSRSHSGSHSPHRSCQSTSENDSSSCHGGNSPRITAARCHGGSSSLLDFEVVDIFLCGTPLGLVLASRGLNSSNSDRVPARPQCQSVYNLFHPTNPVACRLEPLICPSFTDLAPVNVARHHKFPLGDGQPTHLFEYVYNNPLFADGLSGGPCPALFRRESAMSVLSTASGADVPGLATVDSILQRWWGEKRLDYALYSPDGLVNFPSHALPHLFHASYWESQDVIAFILRNVLRGKQLDSCSSSTSAFSPPQPCEKWVKKRTSVKIKNISSNHRGNDVLVRDGLAQTIAARFSYGPLDMISLTGERVDIYVMKDPPNGQWSLIGSELSDKHGRVSYTFSENCTLGFGLYPVKMVVKGDHTWCDLELCVVPARTECVVFSIDGSFTASVSVTGRDPKVRASAVHVARHWHELGYLILYITGRPDIQKRRVLSWLEQHNFPHGLISFADGITTEPLKHKADYLRKLVEESQIIIHVAYGSSKDIGVYTSVGLTPEQIYIVGKPSKKHPATFLNDGYATHLASLTSLGGSRPAQGNASMFLSRDGFSSCSMGLSRRRSAKRATSFPAQVTSSPLHACPPGVSSSSQRAARETLFRRANSAFRGRATT